MAYNQPPFDDERLFHFPGFQGGWPSYGSGKPGYGPGVDPGFSQPSYGSGYGPGYGSGVDPGFSQPGYSPGYGQPGYGPGFVGGGYPDGQQQVGPPNTPPPAFTPQQPETQGPPGVSTFAIDPGSIRGCLYQFTYIWQRWGGFWFYPTYVGRRSVSGYRWQRNRWVYYGLDINDIQSFQCY